MKKCYIFTPVYGTQEQLNNYIANVSKIARLYFGDDIEIEHNCFFEVADDVFVEVEPGTYTVAPGRTKFQIHNGGNRDWLSYLADEARLLSKCDCAITPIFDNNDETFIFSELAKRPWTIGSAINSIVGANVSPWIKGIMNDFVDEKFKSVYPNPRIEL